MQKKSLESMSFFSSSTSGEFYPEGLCVSFSFTVSLSNEIKGLSSIDCNFQELSRTFSRIFKVRANPGRRKTYSRDSGVKPYFLISDISSAAGHSRGKKKRLAGKDGTRQKPPII